MNTPADFLHQLFGLQGQVAVVIGGTGVLGGAIASGLAQAGAHVVIAGRSQERGQTCVRAIVDAGGAASFFPADVNSRTSLQDLADHARQFSGCIDVLVNCAGVNSAVPYLEITEDDWQRVVEGNLTATHLACQVFGGLMISQTQGGSILNIGSVTADVPLSRVFAYSASKAAVVNLTKNLAREWAGKRVRVNVLCPGFFPAEQNKKILDAVRTENVLRNTPMARFGEPHELVATAILLCSRTAGSFITGADFYVDGGFTGTRF